MRLIELVSTCFTLILLFEVVSNRLRSFWFVLLLFLPSWLFHVAFGVISKLGCFRLFQVVSNCFLLF